MSVCIHANVYSWVKGHRPGTPAERLRPSICSRVMCGFSFCRQTASVLRRPEQPTPASWRWDLPPTRSWPCQSCSPAGSCHVPQTPAATSGSARFCPVDSSRCWWCPGGGEKHRLHFRIFKGCCARTGRFHQACPLYREKTSSCTAAGHISCLLSQVNVTSDTKQRSFLAKTWCSPVQELLRTDCTWLDKLKAFVKMLVMWLCSSPCRRAGRKPCFLTYRNLLSFYIEKKIHLLQRLCERGLWWAFIEAGDEQTTIHRLCKIVGFTVLCGRNSRSAPAWHSLAWLLALLGETLHLVHCVSFGQQGHSAPPFTRPATMSSNEVHWHSVNRKDRQERSKV